MDSVENQKLSKFTVLLLDEIDFLTTGDGNVFYSFFNWPIMINARLALIGISNVMELTGRLTSRVKSRIGNSLTRVSFRPYTYEEVRISFIIIISYLL